MKTYVVQLENHDDVISARDKISWSKARRILLIWPRRGKVLERKVDLLLVQRHCQLHGAQLAVVTNSIGVVENAAELGIPIFQSADEAQQATWHRIRGAPRNAQAQLHKDRRPVLAQTLREQRAQLTPKAYENRWLNLAMFCVGVFSFLGLALFFAPGARVRLSPALQSQQITLPVSAQVDIPVANPSGGIPAHTQSVIVEGRDQAPSSGRILVPDGYATGQVLLTNLTSSEVAIPDGSLLLAGDENPLMFQTTGAVHLPVGKVLPVPARAVAPGSASNVASGQIRSLEGQLGFQVLVDNPQPFRGGSDRFGQSPTQKDFQSLREKLAASLEKMALEELRTNRKDGQVLLDGSIQIRKVLEENREPAENQAADQLQITMRVEYEIWYIEEKDLRAVSQAALDANLPSGFQPVSGSLSYQFTPGKQLEKAQAGDGLALRGDLTAQRTIEAILPISSVIESIRGREVADATRFLQLKLHLAAAPKVDIYPSWWNRMPFLSFRIDVITQ